MTLSSAAKGWAPNCVEISGREYSNSEIHFPIRQQSHHFGNSEASITSTSISGCFRRYVDRRPRRRLLAAPSY